MKPIALATPNLGAAKSDLATTQERAILRIATFSTAATLGTAVAALEALRSGPSGFFFQISPGTFVAFAAGAAAAMLFWWMAARSSAGARAASVLLVLGGIGLFLYPLRFVPRALLPQVAAGLGTAVVVLSTLGYMIWRMRGFLEAEDQQTQSENSRALE